MAEAGRQHYTDSLSNSFGTAFEKAVKEREGLQKGTDIFGALNQCTRYAGDSEAPLIILLSDIMNWSSDLKMEPGNFSAASLDAALQKAPTVKLGNTARVFVFTGNTAYIPADHYKTVQEFWKRYFQNQRITLVDYGSGAIKQLEEEVSE